jgi:hypothetical protein
MEKNKGAIWVRRKKNGEPYLSIKLEDKNYVAFQNSYKNKENQPDYQVYDSKSGNNTSPESIEAPVMRDNPKSSNYTQDEIEEANKAF